MIFDVQELLKTDGARVQIEGKLIPPEEFQTDEIQFHDDCRFVGQLENIGGVLELKAEAEGTFSTICARCTKPLEEAFKVSVTETLASESAEVTDRDAVIPLIGTSVDLNAVIWPSILSEMPTKFLCAPDCQGLCPHCGINLNEDSCTCEVNVIDPRWADLLNWPRG